jgi:hypothetical protein
VTEEEQPSKPPKPPIEPYDEIRKTDSGSFVSITDQAKWNWGQIGARVTPSWWNLIRQMVIFVLGVFCVVYVIATPGANLVLLIVGLVLLGIVPVDHIMLNRFLKR